MSVTPHADVWMYDPNSRFLTPPTEILEPDNLIKSSQSFTISFVSCVVPKNFESRRHDDNDILILTKSQIGNSPKIERVHFWGKDIPENLNIDDIWAETVLLVEDYDKGDTLVIEWHVLEIDSDDGIRAQTINSLRSLVSSFGSAFPVLVPFMAASNSVIGLVKAILSKIETNEQIIQARFSLRSGEGNVGTRVNRKFLQPATYVVFENEVYGSGYSLDPQSGRVRKYSKNDNGDEILEDPEEAYLVFEVIPKIEISHSELVGDNIATLMTQIRDNKNTSSGQFTINFLQETLDYYTTYKKLLRYRELSDEANRTEAEEERFNRLSTDQNLKELLELFIPS